MCVGLWNIKNSKNYIITTWFGKTNKIRNTLALWSFETFVTGFVLFFVIAFISSDISREVFISLPIFIMIYSLISIIFSISTGKNFEAPFKQIENNIRTLMLNYNISEIDDKFSIEEFIFLQQFIIDAFKDKAESHKAQLLVEAQKNFNTIIGQMMHDIQSPLVSLRTIIDESISDLPDTTRTTLRNVAASISGITSQMLSKYSNIEETQQKQELLVFGCVLRLLEQKRYQFKNLDIQFETDFDEESNFAFIHIDASSFERMLSNLINNAVDAFANNIGQVKLTLRSNATFVAIMIEDNGKGMPPEVVNKIQSGIAVTAGKVNGHGLGLTQVWDTIKNNNGELSIRSIVNDGATKHHGTTMILRFPRMTTPKWITQQINLTKYDTVVILDDDKSIHEVWKMRLKPLLNEYPTLKVEHFLHGKGAIEFINGIANKGDIYFLTDYELTKQSLTGIEVIQQSGLKRAILVTSHYTDSDIRVLATQANVRLLPKELIPAISIKVDQKLKPGSREVDFVWVDDQITAITNIVHSYFGQFQVDTYAQPEELFDVLIQYPLDTRIILDTHYYDAEGYTGYGIDIAQALHTKGYTRLFLFAGEEIATEKIPPYLTVVLKTGANAILNLNKALFV
jgi:signal transduction histidine kinase